MTQWFRFPRRRPPAPPGSAEFRQGSGRLARLVPSANGVLSVTGLLIWAAVWVAYTR